MGALISVYGSQCIFPRKMVKDHSCSSSLRCPCCCRNLGVALADRAILRDCPPRETESKWSNKESSLLPPMRLPRKSIELEEFKGMECSSNRGSRTSSRSGDEDPDEYGWWSEGEIDMETVSDYGAVISGRLFSQPSVCTPVHLPEQLMRQSVSMQAMWQVGIDSPQDLERHSPPGQFPESVSRARLQKICSGESFVEQPELVLEKENKFGGQSVSKSYECRQCRNVSMIVLQVPRFQVVRHTNGVQHAEFLVKIQFGTLILAAWRRYTDFERLFHAVISDSRTRNKFPNTTYSWELVRHRKRWYRCLEEEYLTLKCFLLERFLHDLVYECEETNAICKFIGA